MHPGVVASVVLLVGLGQAGPARAAGPGLGNLQYEPDELYKPVHIFDHSNGTPDDSPGNAFGHNVVTMVDGYLMLLFAMDSGGAAGGLLFYDVSDPRHPELVRTVRDADTEDLRETHSLPLASANGRHYLAVQTAHGVQFWDVTTAMGAHAIAKLDLEGVNGGDYEDVAWQLAWQWPYLFVSGGNLGVFVVDTSDPADPQVVTRVPTSQTGGFRVGPIFAAGDYLVISNMDQDGQYGLMDISNPADPALLATLGDLPKIYSMAVLGDRIYGAGRDSSQFLVHSFGPAGLEEVSRTHFDGDGLYVSVQDGFVHYGLTDSYMKLDIHDEHDVRQMTEVVLDVEHADHGQTTPLGNLVFIGNDHGSGSAFLCHQLERDQKPPEVVKIFPADGTTHEAVTGRISVAFSDNMDLRSVGPGTLTIRKAGGATVAGGYSYVFNTVAFGPDEPFEPDTTYEIVLAAGGVKDTMGNALAGEVLSRFSTGDAIVVPEPAPIDAGAPIAAPDATVANETPAGTTTGGCGCTVGARTPGASAWALALLTAAGLLVRRRGARSRSAT